MENLRFLVFKKPLPAPRHLSMDDYLRFVSFNIKHAFNKIAYQKWKKMSGVNAPFVIKPERRRKTR